MSAMAPSNLTAKISAIARGCAINHGSVNGLSTSCRVCCTAALMAARSRHETPKSPTRSGYMLGGLTTTISSPSGSAAAIVNLWPLMGVSAAITTDGCPVCLRAACSGAIMHASGRSEDALAAWSTTCPACRSFTAIAAR